MDDSSYPLVTRLILNYSQCGVSQSILNNDTYQALQCAAGQSISRIGTSCIVCPNSDIAGVGVRAAFYIQSLFNSRYRFIHSTGQYSNSACLALLVILSPEDAAASAWAGAVLTAGLVIAASPALWFFSIVSDAVCISYATLSSISSLAIAPMLPVWELPGARRAHTPHSQEHLVEGKDAVLTHGLQQNFLRKERRKTHNRQRAAITFALLSQVVFQWAWGLFLFVDPHYSQPTCNQDTIIWILYFPLNVRNVNEAGYAVWPAWLLFCLGVTLFYTIALAVSSGVQTHKGPPRISTISIASSIQSAHTFVPVQLCRVMMAAVPEWGNVRGKTFVWGNVVAVILWTSYIIISEFQIQSNCIYSGENSLSGFGQITSVFLALTPVWSLIVALYRLPGKLRKAERGRARGRARGAEEQLLLAHLDHGRESKPEDCVALSWLEAHRVVWNRLVYFCTLPAAMIGFTLSVTPCARDPSNEVWISDHSAASDAPTAYVQLGS
ncbi:hypothetical protein POSPLADRAFT_1174552 [Postia placenta MAD-698-R-SB12]|uniref:Uncharacterized protein n=1 Tax=Postia placenta MAD-698-R-SB12 TaxID=670580 RepID=A0A1X6ML92_9APHY|nr:hypothetical protein POSPLADRAFT_1174552 [Postia placenta MAD-698-R-SB12]OSX57088.1 hypothetical protein POSPLADRAFT_1174552 [Postia placenta MAD-698-R-SB12]